MTIETLVGIYATLFGLVVGSYLNVVAYRLPRGISTVLPRSRCPRCQRAIAPWDNIPVFSYLVLRGRCRHCGVVIHWRYPLFEALTGLLFLFSYLRFGLTTDTLVAILFSSVMAVLAAIDLEHRFLPDVLTLPTAALGLLIQVPAWIGMRPWVDWASPREALIGALGGAGVLLVLRGVWILWRGTPGMGLGDVKMVAAMGAVLGWGGLLVAMAFASFIGTIVALLGMIRGRLHLGSTLPFGFFLAIGAIVSLLAEERLLAMYVGWVRELVP